MGKKSNLSQRLIDDAYFGLVIPAFQEAELDPFKDKEIHKRVLTRSEDRHVILLELPMQHDHVIKIEAVIDANDNPDDPRAPKLNVSCALGGIELAPSVVLTCRYDVKGPQWSVNATGTLSLPVGHPLAELAHGETHLDLGRRTMSPLDGREAFQTARKMGHIWLGKTF